MAPADVEQCLQGIPGWAPADGHTKLRKSFPFRDFATALAYVNRLAAVAEEQDHHPDVEFGWGYVHLTWTTHNIRGLSENDFTMAATSDLLFQDLSGAQGSQQERSIL